MSDWNSGVIDEFRANEGRVGGMFDGKPLLILNTTGAKTGAERQSPLMYLDHEDRMYVFASKAGAHSHPDWYHNVKANPAVSIEIGTTKVDKTAVELSLNERDRIYAHQADLHSNFADYEAATDRVIPVIELV